MAGSWALRSSERTLESSSIASPRRLPCARPCTTCSAHPGTIPHWPKSSHTHLRSLRRMRPIGGPRNQLIARSAGCKLQKIPYIHPALVNCLSNDDAVQVWTAFFHPYEAHDVFPSANAPAGDHPGAHGVEHGLLG